MSQEYISKSSDFLKVEDVKDGDKLKIVEDAYSTFNEAKQKVYWNCKVQLPDGSTRIAGIMDQCGDEFVKKWGKMTGEWTGHTVTVEIRTSKAGNQYIVLLPTDEPKVELPKTETTVSQGVKYPTEQIDPNDIPF